MRKINLFLFAFLFASQLNAQLSSDAGRVVSTRQHMMLIEANPVSKKIETYYLYDHWSFGNITSIKGEKLEDVQLRYNLLHKLVEISTPSGVKAIETSKIKEFNWVNHKGEKEDFINLCELKSKLPLHGVGEVLADGKTKLVLIKKLSYNQHQTVKYGAGPKPKSYNVDSELYLVQGQNYILLENRKKDLLRFFNERSDEIKKFTKENKLKYIKVSDLVKIINYCNGFSEDEIKENN